MHLCVTHLGSYLGNKHHNLFLAHVEPLSQQKRTDRLQVSFDIRQSPQSNLLVFWILGPRIGRPLERLASDIDEALRFQTLFMVDRFAEWTAQCFSPFYS